MCGNKWLFTDYVRLKDKILIKLGDEHFVHGIGRGNVEIEAYDGKRWVNKYLKNVLHVPGIKFNLFSMDAALAKEILCVSTNFECVFHKNDIVVALAERSSEKDLYKMKFRLSENIEKCNFVNTRENKNNSSKNERKNKSDNNVNIKNNITRENKCKETNMLQVWHERLAYQNIESVKRFLAKNNIEVNSSAPFCDVCALGKMHRLPFPQSESKTLRVGELIHADQDIFSY